MDAMWNFLTPAMFGAAARWIVGLLAGALLARGWMTAQDSEPLVAALVSLLTLLWSIWQKHHQAQVLAAMRTLPANATPVGASGAQVLAAAALLPKG